MDNINLDRLSTDEKLLLLELLAGKIMADMPDSVIACQVAHHAAILNGKSRYGEKTMNLRAYKGRGK